MPSFLTVFLFAVVAGAGWAVAHYYGAQLAAKVHQLVGRVGGAVHPTLGTMVGPTVVTPVTEPAASAPTLTPTILTEIRAQDAYMRYQNAGGMAQAVVNKFFEGGLGWYEICWLRSRPAAQRHQWAADFASMEPLDPASFSTVGGVNCTTNVASYLLTLRNNYGITFDA